MKQNMNKQNQLYNMNNAANDDDPFNFLDITNLIN